MLLAKVIGTVVASVKSARTDGLKMLILQPLDLEGQEANQSAWTVDPHVVEGHVSRRRFLQREMIG